MSFLVDPPLLIASGAAIELLAPTETSADLCEAAVIGVFIGTSVSLYLDAKWTEPIWRLCGAKSGKDWMINSGVFSFDYDGETPKADVMAGLLFSTYPFWIKLGRVLARPLSPLSRLRKLTW